MSHPVLSAAESALAASLAWAGELSLLGLRRQTLLISRTKRHPAPDTPWVIAATAAVKKICGSGQALVTGWNRLPFNLALWSSRKMEGAAIVALPAPPGEEEDILAHAPPRYLVVWPRQPLKGPEALRQRDLLLAWLSDGAYALHVRPGGNMAAAREVLLKRNCPVIEWPAVLPPLTRGGRGGEALPNSLPRPQKKPGLVSEIELPTPWDHLTHFTRGPEGAWPGETRASYLDWLGGGAPFAPRDGFAALCRILREKRLRAGGKLLPSSIPMVCFSALPPPQAAPLRRWRKGLARWTFSHYGLAIRKETLIKLGAQPVRYVSREELRQAPAEERRFLQLAASQEFAWSSEAEWRVRGDINLAGLPASSLLALVTTPAEAQTLTAEFGLKAYVNLNGQGLG